jgi:hypothetical protein
MYDQDILFSKLVSFILSVPWTDLDKRTNLLLIVHFLYITNPQCFTIQAPGGDPIKNFV